MGAMAVLRLLAVLPQAVLLAATAALAFLSGGYIFVRVAPVALGLALAALVWVWAGRRERIPLVYLIGLAAFAGLALWTGLSVLWSVGPDLSWVAFDVAVLYVAVAWVAVAVPGGRAQLRVVGYGYTCVATTVATYALLGKVLPDVVTHAHTYARLSEPVGYWNVLAITAVFGAVLALEAAARRDLRVPLRAAAAGALVLLVFTLFFAFSRGGLLAFGLALLVFFVLSNQRLSAAFSLAVALGCTAAVLLHVRALTTLFDATDDAALRTAQGHTLGRWVLVALVVVVTAQVAAALVQKRVRLARGARVVIGSAVLAALLAGVVLAGALYFPAHGGVRQWTSSHYRTLVEDNTTQGAGAGRLLAFGTNGRIHLYREALRGAEGHQALGTGAGTFLFTHFEQRTDSGVVKHAHSQWFNVYSELGVTGLALFAAVMAGLVLAAFARLFRDRADPDRALLAAVQACIVAFVFHVSIDWDWDMASATVAFLLFAATACGFLRSRAEADTATATAASSERTGKGAGSQRRRAAGLSLPARALASGTIVLVIVSWTLPYLSLRAYGSAVSEASRERIGTAVAAAERASLFDPLAVDPLLVLAKLEQQQGHARQARETLQKALRLQPRNYKVYFELGLLELNTFGRKAEAATWFRRALVLNPKDEATRYELSVAGG
jgi:O-antigen ligase